MSLMPVVVFLIFVAFLIFINLIKSRHSDNAAIKKVVRNAEIMGVIIYFIFILIILGMHVLEASRVKSGEVPGLEYQVKNGTVKLKWSAVDDERDYYLTILQDGIVRDALWVSGTSYSVSDVFDGNIITFRVAASGESGVSVDYVKKYEVQPLLLNPFGKVNSGEIMFSWDITYLADSYYLEIISLDDEKIQQIYVPERKASVQVSDLQPGKYKWAVTPETAEGLKGRASDWAYFEVSDIEQQAENILGVEKSGLVSMLNTSLTYPEAAVIGPDGALYVSDTHSNVIRRCKDGINEIYVGTLVAGKSKNGFRNQYEINRPADIVFDHEGNMFFSDYNNCRICKVEYGTGEVSPVWEHGETVKNFYIESDGSFTILCNGGKIVNSALGEIVYDGCILGNPVALIKNGRKTIILDGGRKDIEPKLILLVDNKFENSVLCAPYSSALFKDKDGNLYVGEHTAIFKLDWELKKQNLNGNYANITYITQGEGETLLVTDSDAGGVYSVDKYSGEKTLLVGSKSISSAVVEIEERDNYLYFLDNQSGVVWRYNGNNGTTERFIGNGKNELAALGCNRLETGLFYPGGLTTDNEGNFYISEQHHILKINKEGNVELFAGRGDFGYQDGTAEEALFQSIRGISFDDESQTLYVADTYNNRIRRIKDGVVSTVAGNGMQGELVFGVPATSSPLNRPHDVIIEDGQIYISDSWNNTVARIDENGILSPVAGEPIYKIYQGEGKYFGDGKDAQKAGLNTPLNMDYHNGVLYIVDSFNNRIRVVADGKIDTIIGSDQKGYDPENSMILNFPSAVYVDDDYIYVADTGNYLVRRYKREFLETPKVVN